MEVPSLLMELNNTNYVCYPLTDSSIVLIRIQGPQKNWKISVGTSVAIIQEEISSAIWIHVPSQFNPDDLTSRGIEPSTFSPSSVGEGTTQVITGAVKLTYNRGQQHRTHQSLDNSKDSTIPNILRPTGNHNSLHANPRAVSDLL